MNKIFSLASLACLLAASLTGCGGKTDGAVTAPDTVRYEQRGKGIEAHVFVEFPSEGNALLRNAVAEYVSETLGGTYEGTLESGDSIVGYYGEAIYSQLKAQHEEFKPDSELVYTRSYEIKKEYETPAFVSYVSFMDEFTGGVHGIYASGGVTFRKADGRRFGWEMLHDTQDETFHQLLKKGLMEYFNDNDAPAESDEQLQVLLIVDANVDYLPLPLTPPYLSEKGMTFIYQCYEIAPYAAGSPTFTISYDKLAPYLTSTVKRLITPDPKIEINK